MGIHVAVAYGKDWVIRVAFIYASFWMQISYSVYGYIYACMCFNLKCRNMSTFFL